jgi:8-oxo-dGTP pyrophosphatase MutT (NUDIX family)
MGAAAKNTVEVRILNVGSLASRRATKIVRIAHLRRLKECEKVAAVCYRMHASGIQFLLVQTRRGRWTFPKGHVEPGLTHAQAAALEAFEEAGVHGRMAEASFARYVDYKHRHSSFASIRVSAHLCEVSRLESPPEPGRNRTWFSPDSAKQRLRQRRKPDHSAPLVRVVDRAVAHILHQPRFYESSPPKPPRVAFIDGVRSGAARIVSSDPKEPPQLIRMDQRRLLPGKS